MIFKQAYLRFSPGVIGNGGFQYFPTFVGGTVVYEYDFDIVKGLTDGGPNNATQMLSTYMYSQVFQYNNVGYGTAIACVMVLMMMLVIIPYISISGYKELSYVLPQRSVGTIKYSGCIAFWFKPKNCK